MHDGQQIAADDIKQAARGFGADLIGIASIERFDNIAPQAHPSQIFPETCSVLVIGRRITRGSLRGVEEGTQFGLYKSYGYDWLDNRFLAITTYHLSELLENKGFEAVPLQNLPTQIGPMGVQVAPDRAEPNVLMDFDDAAVRAGLGEIDYGGFLLTPEYGTRQRLQIVLTDADLEPDPVSDAIICDFQDQYAGFCPLGAIRPGEETERVICGKKMRVAGIDFSKCRKCHNGAVTNQYHPAGPPDRIAAVCGRSVYAELEDRGKLSKKFRTSFRRRPTWSQADHSFPTEPGRGNGSRSS